MIVASESIELHCQKCGRLMHIEVENDFAAEVAARLSRFVACEFCSPRRSPQNFHAPASNWLARSNPNN